MKKTVHVVSHTHWDREWYMPYENHHMRLVDLIDGLIEAFKDPEFKYFQLDGHFLPIKDYLEVKPENGPILRKLIETGKLRIGPWYILQDAFLTSGESNIKNLSLGIKNSLKWGEPSKIGYFPDTFGNIGQASQILKKAGIDVAFFGRGVKATGFDNKVFEDFTSRNSEIFWKAPNGDEVLGILFANWYANGLDIPEETSALKVYMDKRLSDMEKYASTNQLLLMNGCDHSPVQKNIGQVIKKANDLYEDYEFIHSNLDFYFESVAKEVGDLDTIKGELRSQTTDGWWTLQSTSSSRYYLKRYNKKLEMKLEELIQPLFTLYVDKKDYPREKIDYLYEKLITNHPHDSICGCSIDEVHDGNLRRFKDVEDGISYLEGLAREKINESTPTNPDDLSLCVINTLPYERNKEVERVVEIDKEYFGSDFPEVYDRLRQKTYEDLKLVDEDDREIPAEIINLDTSFSYLLPKDAFRKPYFARKVKVRFSLTLKPFEKKILRLVKGKSSFKAQKLDQDFVENAYYKIKIKDKASLDIYDKRSDVTYKDVLLIEDTGDIGNEYIYRQSTDGLRILGGKLIDKKITRENDKTIIKLKEKFSLPQAASGKLKAEQIRLNDITVRKADRSEKFVDMVIEKEIKVFDAGQPIEIKIRLRNLAKDHRMRVLFGNDLETDVIYAESIFECVKRRAYPPATWENPDYSQNFNRYVQVRRLDNKGFGVSALGPAEYEMVKGEGLYMTLFRSVGELGDWGYFPTPDAQLLKDELSEMEFDFYFAAFSENQDENKREILGARVPFFALSLDGMDTKGFIPRLPEIDLGDNLYSLLYRNSKGDAIFRIYNPDQKDKKISIKDGTSYDILGEREVSDENPDLLKAYEIKTYKLEI